MKPNLDNLLKVARKYLDSMNFGEDLLEDGIEKLCENYNETMNSEIWNERDTLNYSQLIEYSFSLGTKIDYIRQTLKKSIKDYEQIKIETNESKTKKRAERLIKQSEKQLAKLEILLKK